jgi:GT2 family glycosyltransferase
MKSAILLLTYGRVEETRRTWENNLPGLSNLYWWDNTEDEAEREALLRESERYDICFQRGVMQNIGIAKPLNYLADMAFAEGADFVTTMANDILEPLGYIQARALAVEAFPDAGVIAIPPAETFPHIGVEEKGFSISEYPCVIGNYSIPFSVWQKGVMFCEEMGNYGPIDLDFCNQVNRLGFRCIYLSNMKALHIGHNNPPEYEAAKAKSLAAAWEVFKKRAI